MAGQDSSVMSSLQQLMAEEDQRRAEQVLLAHRRKMEQERELLGQEARRAEQAQRRAEAVAREATERAVAERVAQERLELERQLELERVRADTDLRAKLAVLKLEQQHEVERLAILRDRRLSSLEGQRRLTLALLGTLLAGIVVLYLLLIRPATQRLERSMDQFQRTNAALRGDLERERGRSMSRIGELESQLSQLEAKLRDGRRPTPLPDAKRSGPIIVRPPPLAHPEVCINENDPLCGTLKGR